MWKLFEIKYYKVLVMYTFALQPTVDEKNTPPPRTLPFYLKLFLFNCKHNTSTKTRYKAKLLIAAGTYSSPWCCSGALSSLRATAANTPTAITPEDVSHRRWRDVEGKESWEWKTPELRKKTTSTVSGFQHTDRPRPSSPELLNKDHNAGRKSLSTPEDVSHRLGRNVEG